MLKYCLLLMFLLPMLLHCAIRRLLGLSCGYNLAADEIVGSLITYGEHSYRHDARRCSNDDEFEMVPHYRMSTKRYKRESAKPTYERKTSCALISM